MEKEEKCVVQENSTEEQSTGEKSVLKGKLRYYSGEIQRDVTNLVKWLILAVVVGCVVGAASTLFSFVLKGVTSYRKANGWMFYLLPVMGLIIVFLYEKFGKEDGGTNQVLSTVRSKDDVPLLTTPLIFISTALTCSILCIVWNTDGCGCFCTGGSQCRSDVLYSFDALYDCFSGCIRIRGWNGSYAGGFSCGGYSGADD